MSQDYASATGRECVRGKVTAWGEEKGKSRFAALPYTVTSSQEYSELTPYEVKLIVDLISQYQGKNNGSFVMCFDSVMRGRGWKSKTTLNNARKGLINKGFIFQTRRGCKGRTSLYAVTFYRVDEGKGHTFPRSKYPTNDWMKRGGN